MLVERGSCRSLWIDWGHNPTQPWTWQLLFTQIEPFFKNRFANMNTSEYELPKSCRQTFSVKRVTLTFAQNSFVAQKMEEKNERNFRPRPNSALLLSFFVKVVIYSACAIRWSIKTQNRQMQKCFMSSGPKEWNSAVNLLILLGLKTFCIYVIIYFHLVRSDHQCDIRWPECSRG